MWNINIMLTIHHMQPVSSSVHTDSDGKVCIKHLKVMDHIWKILHHVAAHFHKVKHF